MITALLVVPACDPPETFNNRIAVLALCDYTTSIDKEKARIDLLKNTRKLFRQMPPNTHFKFYTAGINFEGPFIDDSTTNIPEQNIEIFARYSKVLEQKYKEPAPKNTCLFRSFEKMTDHIKSIYRSRLYKKVYLVVFSDMLEACNSGTTFINLEKGNISDKLPLLEAANLQTNSFAAFEDLKVVLAVSSAPHIELDYVGLKQFWAKYFANNGYSQELIFDAGFEHLF